MSDITGPEWRAKAFRIFEWAQCDEDRQLADDMLAAAEQRQQLEAYAQKISLRERADIHGANPLPWIEAQRDTAEARVKELQQQIATLTAERDAARAELARAVAVAEELDTFVAARMRAISKFYTD